MRNIGRGNADANYRYKMPGLVVKHEGRGNGVKTVLVNLEEVSKALQIETHYVLKFIGIELGVQTQSGKRNIIKGTFTLYKLNEVLDKFIAQFVICPQCKDPEMKWHVKKSSSVIEIDCRACGYHQPLKSVHKLCQYIVRIASHTTVAAAASSAKEESKLKHLATVVEVAAAELGSSGGSSETSTSTSLNSAAEDEWSLETSATAIANRRKEEFTVPSGSDTEKEEKLPTFDLDRLLQRSSSRGCDLILECRAALKHIQQLRSIDEVKACTNVLQQLLLPQQQDASALLKRIETVKHVLAALAQSMSAKRVFLDSFAALFFVVGDASLPVILAGRMLLALYEVEPQVVGETDILQWWQQTLPSMSLESTFIKSIEPVVVWLQEAEPSET